MHREDRIQRLDSYFEFVKFTGTLGVAAAVLVTALLQSLSVHSFVLAVGLLSIFVSVSLSVGCAQSLTRHRAGKKSRISESLMSEWLFYGIVGSLIVGLLIIIVPAAFSAR